MARLFLIEAEPAYIVGEPEDWKSSLLYGIDHGESHDILGRATTVAQAWEMLSHFTEADKPDYIILPDRFSKGTDALPLEDKNAYRAEGLVLSQIIRDGKQFPALKDVPIILTSYWNSNDKHTIKLNAQKIGIDRIAYTDAEIFDAIRDKSQQQKKGVDID